MRVFFVSQNGILIHTDIIPNKKKKDNEVYRETSKQASHASRNLV